MHMHTHFHHNDDFIELICIPLGIPFGYWTGGYVMDHIGLLACVTMNGYHSGVVYEWSKDCAVLDDEIFPMVYVEAPGKYTCTIPDKSSAERSLLASSSFLVQSGN